MKNQAELNAEIAALEKERHELSKKIRDKTRALRKREARGADYLEFTVQYLVDGVVEGKRVDFYRGVNIFPHSFEWFLTHCMIVESLRNPGGTNLDLVIDQYSKKFRITEAEKERLMQKYWHKKQETIADIVKQWTNQEREFHGGEEMFIAHMMGGALRKFEFAPVEIKYGILYWIFAYHQHGDFDELRKDIENVPQKIRDLVDSFTAPKF